MRFLLGSLRLLFGQLGFLGLCIGLMSAACGGRGATSSAPQERPTPTLVSCANDSRVLPFKAGVQVKGLEGLYVFTLISSTPTPPANGTNTLVLGVTDTVGEAVANLAVTLVPFMPDHGHGTSVTPQIAATSEGYVVSNLYLFMPGVWRLTFQAQSADATKTDTGVFTFCVAG